MKVLIVVAAFVAVATCWSIPSEKELSSHWHKFKAQHGKNYDSPFEETYRMKIFKDNAIMIAKHNARFKAGEVTFTLGVNKFADMLPHEVTAQMASAYRGGVKRAPPVRNVPTVDAAPLSWPWNEKVDWRTEGHVTHVKDQSKCENADWAFAVTGALEGQLSSKTKKLVSLSAQQLIDCLHTSSNHNNCHEQRNRADAFSYVMEHSLDTEASYPYKAEQQLCSYNYYRTFDLTNVTYTESGSEVALAAAVKNVGPISVAIDASNPSFQLYKSGIYYEPKCSSHTLNRHVLVVGYGKDLWNEYWIVKNSWGLDWGEAGYIRMARNRKNNCGIATEASYPTLIPRPAPEKSKVNGMEQVW